MFCPFGEHGVETHIGSHLSYHIAVYQFGVPESLGFLPEQFFYPFGMGFNLPDKFFFISQRSQGMVFRFGDKFHTTRCCKLAEAVYHFRDILCKLIQCCTRNRIAYLEPFSEFIDQLKHHAVCRQITLFCHPPDNMPVLIIIVVIVVLADVEKPVGP